MINIFFDDLDVLYHLAKFGEDRITRRGCRCENGVFVFVFGGGVTLRVRCTLPSSGA